MWNHNICACPLNSPYIWTVLRPVPETEKIKYKTPLEYKHKHGFIEQQIKLEKNDIGKIKMFTKTTCWIDKILQLCAPQSSGLP